MSAANLTVDDLYNELNAGSLRVIADTLPRLPKRDPLFDTGTGTNANGAHPKSIKLFIDNTNMNDVTNPNTAIGGTKTQGRDCNTAEMNRLLGDGEKFWVAGCSMKIDAPDKVLQSSVANACAFQDEVRRLRGLGRMEWAYSAGNAKFFNRPLRDIPTQIMRIASFSIAVAADRVAFVQDEPGMMDLRVGPSQRTLYIEGPDNSRVTLFFDSSTALLTPTVDIAWQFQFEGIRLTYKK